MPIVVSLGFYALVVKTKPLNMIDPTDIRPSVVCLSVCLPVCLLVVFLIAFHKLLPMNKYMLLFFISSEIQTVQILKSEKQKQKQIVKFCFREAKRNWNCLYCKSNQLEFLSGNLFLYNVLDVTFN